MNQYYFIFHSVTAAQQGYNVLRQNNITSAIVSAPKSDLTSGCGFALRVKESTVRAALLSLRRSNLPVRYVLTSDDGYHYREVRL